ncbi:unnamed protein product [Mytilus edulis]|uniref:DH domain-containing protein n=1 Tax=Mytilus edulis TaxID=6550 RepID=A0A8S3TK59_MYTED|nr:unnamed protein product [Mytilus edulis]
MVYPVVAAWCMSCYWTVSPLWYGLSSSCFLVYVMLLDCYSSMPMLSGEDGIGIADLLTQATMDQRINSYRLIMASTRAILDSDGSSGSPCVDPDLDDVFEELGLQNDQEEEEDDPRYDVVNDLQKTEREYCRLLRSILNTYGEPLRKFSSLTAEDHKVLFVGIEPILSISAMLTSKFEDVLKTWDSSASQIGNLFSSKFWNLYEDYLKNYSKARKLLEDRCTEDQSFLEFCNLRKGQTTYNLQTLLHLPVIPFGNDETRQNLYQILG